MQFSYCGIAVLYSVLVCADSQLFCSSKSLVVFENVLFYTATAVIQVIHYDCVLRLIEFG